jgi:CheY-like chemotaxis protein
MPFQDGQGLRARGSRRTDQDYEAHPKATPAARGDQATGTGFSKDHGFWILGQGRILLSARPINSAGFCLVFRKATVLVQPEVVVLEISIPGMNGFEASSAC